MPKSYLDEIQKNGGAFVRQESSFRNIVSKDSKEFPPEAGRYHLYLAHPCGWCHRVHMTVALKGLEDVISISFVNPVFGDIGGDRKGWIFDEDHKDPYGDKKTVMEIYKASEPNYGGKATVPVFWDKKTRKIVNNESADILKFLNTEFDSVAKNPGLDLRPAALLPKIEALSKDMYEGLNNGVYRAGFATDQKVYESACRDVFATLDKFEGLLDKTRFVAGDEFTEADVRLFATLIRFDSVYQVHFKCSLRKLEEYHNLSNYTREIFQIPAIKRTVEMDEIRRHYYMSHTNINPTRIVPLFDVNYDRPHDRSRLPSSSPFASSATGPSSSLFAQKARGSLATPYRIHRALPVVLGFAAGALAVLAFDLGRKVSTNRRF